MVTDKSAYSNYSLALATLRFVRRVKAEQPELWKQIQEDAAKVANQGGHHNVHKTLEADGH